MRRVARQKVGCQGRRPADGDVTPCGVFVVLPSTPFVKALVRWATGKRLTNHLPKLSLITLSPTLNSGILGLRMGLYVPTPKFFYNLWGPRESDSSDS